jgi:hypothetical protein
MASMMAGGSHPAGGVTAVAQLRMAEPLHTREVWHDPKKHHGLQGLRAGGEPLTARVDADGTTKISGPAGLSWLS